jgi:hypothetical protein
MDFARLLVELHAERQRLDQAIGALERVAQTIVKRKGRKPKWLAEAQAGGSSASALSGGGKKRFVSPEARKRMAEAQKRRWAKVRQNKK